MITRLIQLFTGIMLSIRYNNAFPFTSIIISQININFRWILRFTHRNLVSFIFILMYTHMIRGIYYNSFKLKSIWLTGRVLITLIITISFTGYILPWRQISYWGAIVITNLFSSVPLIGTHLTIWIWGNHNLSHLTLNRIQTIHFLSPLLIILLIIIHLRLLHKNLSNNPIGIKKIDFLPLSPMYTLKDLTIFRLIIRILMNIIILCPSKLNNYDNFVTISHLITPIKIEPEWYFLFFYSILRSTPNKIGGIILIAISIVIICLIPLTYKQKFQVTSFYPPNKVIIWFKTSRFIILTLIGRASIEYPFINIRKLFIVIFFMIFLNQNLTQKIWDKII
jgi:ubiquinol-cytochrome c reductase cytochrome b subunit